MSSVASQISTTLRAFTLLKEGLEGEGYAVAAGESIEPDDVLYIASELVSRQPLGDMAKALHNIEALLSDVVQVAAESNEEDATKLRVLKARREAEDEDTG